MAIHQHHAFVVVCFRISKWSRGVQQGAKRGMRSWARFWRRINTLYSDI